MIHEINKHLAERAKLKKELKEWVKNKDIPLNTRWDTFIMSKLGDEESYLEKFKNLPIDGHYENLYFERYEIVRVNNLIERVLDAIEEYKEDPEDEYLPSYIVKAKGNIDIDALKEEILENFIYSFKFDW